MSAWERELDDLKREVLTKTIEDPVAEGLPVEEATELQQIGVRLNSEGLDKIRAVAKNLQTKQPPPMRVVQGWQVAMSRVRAPDTGKYHRHVSAILWPQGRSSKLIDWDNLGRIIAYLGAPPDPLAVPESPNHAHHWHWVELDIVNGQA